MSFSGDHWRKRAEELRTLAAEATDAGEKQLLLKLIAEYEHLAERAEKAAQKVS